MVYFNFRFDISKLFFSLYMYIFLSGSKVELATSYFFCLKKKVKFQNKLILTINKYKTIHKQKVIRIDIPNSFEISPQACFLEKRGGLVLFLIKFQINYNFLFIHFPSFIYDELLVSVIKTICNYASAIPFYFPNNFTYYNFMKERRGGGSSS